GAWRAAGSGPLPAAGDGSHLIRTSAAGRAGGRTSGLVTSGCRPSGTRDGLELGRAVVSRVEAGIVAPDRARLRDLGVGHGVVGLVRPRDTRKNVPLRRVRRHAAQADLTHKAHMGPYSNNVATISGDIAVTAIDRGAMGDSVSGVAEFTAQDGSRWKVLMDRVQTKDI